MPENLKGIKKISEKILQEGRAMILTKEEAERIESQDGGWHRIPDGTIMVDPATGDINIKLEGQSAWFLTDIRNSDIIEIKKDAKIILESYTIEDADLGNGTFRYILNWTAGEGGQDPASRIGQLTEEGQVFSLVKGDYLMGSNKIEVIINNEKIYSQEGGGIKELTPESFELLEAVPTGTNVLVKYVKEYSLTGTKLGTSIFYGEIEPGEASAGDLWFKKIVE